MTGRYRKRVEVDERKMTDGKRKLFHRTQEAELQSWMDHQVVHGVIKWLLTQIEL